MSLRFSGSLALTAAAVALWAGSPGRSQVRREVSEPAFLDLVDQEGLVLITAKGAAAVDAEARRRGVQLPALAYWSPEGICFHTPAKGDCNGIFRP